MRLRTTVEMKKKQASPVSTYCEPSLDALRKRYRFAAIVNVTGTSLGTSPTYENTINVTIVTAHTIEAVMFIFSSSVNTHAHFRCLKLIRPQCLLGDIYAIYICFFSWAASEDLPQKTSLLQDIVQLLSCHALYSLHRRHAKFIVLACIHQLFSHSN